MMNVLIADDEIKVCQLIYKLIGWEALGLTMSSMVHSGIDAGFLGIAAGGVK